jgi:hypothetical protein
MTDDTNDKAARQGRGPLERSGAKGPRERQRWGGRRSEAPRFSNDTNDKAARQGRAPLERSGAKGPRERQRWGVRRGEAPRFSNDTNDKAARQRCVTLEGSGAKGRVGRGVGRGEAPRSGNKKLAAIRRLYFETKPSTILRDFDRAIDILKSMDNEKDRERATVYMQGLAEMRKGWTRR